jgi:hypothetical protein
MKARTIWRGLAFDMIEYPRHRPFCSFYHEGNDANPETTYAVSRTLIAVTMGSMEFLTNLYHCPQCVGKQKQLPMTRKHVHHEKVFSSCSRGDARPLPL